MTGRANDLAVLGPNVFFWARVVDWPTYLAGIHVLRTVLWGVSLIGLAMMIVAIW